MCVCARACVHVCVCVCVCAVARMRAPHTHTHTHTLSLSLSLSLSPTHTQTLDFFRGEQSKVVAFAGGLHVRLGAVSCVSWLNDQTLVMIADEVLGQWSLVKEWLHDKES